MNADTARESLEWTKQYFNDVLTPLQQKADARADTAADQATTEYNDNRTRALQQDDRYQRLGLPAEDRFYRMADSYSEDAEQERQANLAAGDVVSAGQMQQAGLQRQLAAQGIDPTSPAAIAAATDASVMRTAMQSSAANQARSAARQLGMAMTSDAANFGRGGQAGIATFSNMASGNSAQALAAGNSTLGNAQASGNFVQGGYRNANAAYGQNMQTWASMANSQRQANAAIEAGESAGFGSAIGGALGLAGAMYMRGGTGK
jgi:hypothetical protein